ncbi:MAG: biotin/lipoyl-containing protein [candidate division WOR-3 bacterium]
MRFLTTIQDRTFEIEIYPSENGRVSVRVDKEPVYLDYETDKNGVLATLIIDGRRYEVRCDDSGGKCKVYLWQKSYDVTLAKAEVKSNNEITSAEVAHRIIRAPMSGLVIAIYAKPGENVKPGDALILLEAMKMQNEIRSPIAGKISRIYAKVGKTVEKGEKLLELEPF